MKGTWPRGRTRLLDKRARYLFSQDIKNRVENVMIADLLRNDLGRIAGNVRAPKINAMELIRKIESEGVVYELTNNAAGGLKLLRVNSIAYQDGAIVIE
jgi:anthranilate/para-aminobenzoate synthase component I